MMLANITATTIQEGSGNSLQITRLDGGEGVFQGLPKCAQTQLELFTSLAMQARL